MEEKTINYTWGHNRPFNAYSNYFKNIFGSRVQKLSIDAGFTCPNRDGKLAYGGCSYCNNNAFNPSYCQPQISISQQIDEGIAFHEHRYRKAENYLAYFQPYSNTYAPIDILQRRYNEALQHPKIVGLVIGTRPDCISLETIELLKEINKNYYLIVEIGIESCYDKTLLRINRGHNFETTQNTIKLLSLHNIKVGGHLIFGLPGETREQMYEEAKILSGLPLSTMKFHQLQIFKETAMEQDFLVHPNDYRFFSIEEYIEFIIDFLEYFSPSIVVERFAGEVPPRFQGGPNWGKIRNEQLFARIESRFKERKTFQGRKFIEEL